MRFFPVFLLFICLSSTAAHAAEEEVIEEYQNVPEGLLMPNKDDLPQPADHTGEQDLSEDSEAAMTMEDITNAYAEGKYELIFKRIVPLAESGQHKAEELLGIMYLNGQGVEKNAERALPWLNKAAEANQPLAQHHLGVIYYLGEAVSADTVRALMWLHIAILHYPEGPQKKRAIEDRDNLYLQMTRRDKERAVTMAREWLEKRGEGHLLDNY